MTLYLVPSPSPKLVAVDELLAPLTVFPSRLNYAFTSFFLPLFPFPFSSNYISLCSVINASLSSTYL